MEFERIKEIITKVFFGIIGLGILGGVIGTTMLIYFSFDLPKISTLADYKPPIPSQILAKDGSILAEIGLEKREIALFANIPKRIVNAFLSAEDSGFYEHTGVDYLGVMRALIANLKAGRVVQGGSTITQQVAKSLLLSRERSISRKIKDFLLAQKIEEKFSKEEILFLYLNQVYLGGGYYGVKSAFKGYFEKELSEATIAESAMIAGLLVAPGKYSPYVNPKRAKIRQEYVLKRMYANQKISEDEYKEALSEKIKFRLRKASQFKAGHFTDWVRQRAISLVGEENFLRGGYRVQTTLDWELQQVAEHGVRVGVREIDKRQGYSGPEKNIAEENIEKWYTKLRIAQYKTSARYFTLTENFERQYDTAFQEDELTNIKAFSDENQKDIKLSRILSGYDPKDPFIEYLEEGKEYEAVVREVNNRARLIFVEIAGVRGVIPYAGFRWAHERTIQEEYKFFPFVTRPNEILNKGDVVLVSLKKKSEKLSRVVWKGYSSKLEKLKPKARKNLDKNKYLLLSLEQKPIVEGALVSIDPFTSEIVSFVGGKNFKLSQFNRAIQSKRQPGSAFKPLIFAAGLENNFKPNTIIIDSPESLGGADSSLNWKPRNYDGKFKGPITYRNALEQSRNVPTIKIAHKMGVPLILDYMERIGFNAKLDQDLSLALGSFGVTLMDIVTTYSIFPNGGKKVTPKSIVSITDRDGNPVLIESKEDEISDENIPENEVNANVPAPTPEITEEIVEEEKVTNQFLTTLDGDQVYDPRLSYLMTNLLRGVVLHGTGRRAREISTFLGGKTGTTNSYVDAWFIGFSSNIVTGVWTGFDDNKTLGWGESGAKSALPIWKIFMKAAIKKYGENDFKAPLGIINVLIDKTSGKLSSNQTKSPLMESFVEGTEPGTDYTEVKSSTNKTNDTSQPVENDDFYDSQ